jgi:hypothetical protein
MDTILTSDNAETVHKSIYHASMVMTGLFMLAFTALTLGGQKASYGRYTTNTYGPTVPGIIDWYFHGTSLIALTLCLLKDRFDPREKPQAGLLLLMFAIHYFQRSFLFAWQMDRSKIKPSGFPIP